jgi:hypothetical protein
VSSLRSFGCAFADRISFSGLWGCVPLQVPNEFVRQPFPIRQHSWQVVREVLNVGGENNVALSVQRRGDVHPAANNSLPRLHQFGVSRIMDRARMGKLGDDAFHGLSHRV